ncbi:MAG: 50S ribosomal protein L21 [Calditrichia bacterium]|jgi:large subunit ribosomal protein L21|nr:50S ribosomal protein L21 [Calditrichia bacterium]
MYAIVEISGKQFRVQKDMRLRVPQQESEPGKKIGFDRVLLVEDDKGNTTIGNPLVKNTQVAATVIEHGRDKKVIVFKKKRRKGYQKKQGHRQGYSVIEINTIGAPTVKMPVPAAKASAPAAKKEVKITKKAAVKKTTTVAAKPKTAGTKTTAAKSKKPVAKTAKTAPKTASKKTESTAATKKPAAKKEAKEE